MIKSKRGVIGTIAENKVMGLLMFWGKQVTHVGQESWLPTWVHNKIRYVNNDDGIVMLRHFPDLATDKALIQVKSAPKESGYEHVTVEAASYDTSMILQELGIPVLFVWMYEDESFHGDWVKDLIVSEPDTPRGETSGSHTPYKLVFKRELKPLKEFISSL